MPMAIPLIVAAAEAYAGVAAMAAATTIAAEVMAGAMIAGAAMSAVGTITHNATLTKVGAVVGIVGSLGTAAAGNLAGAAAADGAAAEGGAGLASSTVDAGEGLQVANQAVDASTASIPTFAADGSQVGTMGSLSGTAGSNVAAAGSASGGLVDGSMGAGGSTGAAANPVQPLVPSEVSAPMDASVDAGATANPGSNLAGGSNASGVASNAPSTVGNTAPGTMNANVTQQAGTQTTGTFGGVGTDPSAVTPNMAGGALDASKGLAPATTGNASWGFGDYATRMGSFMNDHAQLMNTAGGIVSGAMKNASERNAMKEQAEIAANAAKAARDRYNASLKGLTVPTYSKG